MSGSEAFKEPSVKLILDHFKINKWEFGVGDGDTISFSLFSSGRELLFPRGFLLSSRAVIVKFPSELYLSELPLLSLLFSVIQTTYSFIHLSYFSVQCLGCIILKTFLGNEIEQMRMNFPLDIFPLIVTPSAFWKWTGPKLTLLLCPPSTSVFLEEKKNI